MIAFDVPVGWLAVRLLGIVKASNRQMCLACSDASASRSSTSMWSSEIGVLHRTPLGKMPGSYECGPNEPVRLSSHMNAKAPWCARPSVPIHSPFMNRMSV